MVALTDDQVRIIETARLYEMLKNNEAWKKLVVPFLNKSIAEAEERLLSLSRAITDENFRAKYMLYAGRREAFKEIIDELEMWIQDARGLAEEGG